MYKNKPVLIYILPRCPWPPFAGQARLAYFRAKELKKKGYKIILICFNKPNSIKQNNYLKLNKIFHEIYIIPISSIDFCLIAFRAMILRLRFNLPLQSSWLNSVNLIFEFKKRIIYLEKKYKKTFYHFYSIRSYSLWPIIEEYKKPFVIDLIDSMTLNLERRCKISKNIKKYFWNYELIASKNFEQNLPNFKFCKKYMVVSQLDKHNLKVNHDSNEESLYVSSIGYEIPAKLSKFENKERENKNIIFFGSLSYEPNLKGIIWFIKNVLPIVWKKDKYIFVNIAGSNPPKKLKNICKEYKQIKLIANPDSMEELIKKATIAVAPLISGSGQQFKIIESISHGIPVISTTRGAIPFNFKQNKELIIADKPKEFAEAIFYLSKNPKKIEVLRNNAFLAIKNKFSWYNIVNQLEKDIYF